MLQSSYLPPPHALPIPAIVNNKNIVEAINSTEMVDDKRLRLDTGKKIALVIYNWPVS